MPTSRDFQNDFYSNIRQRGAEYFRRGAVKITHATSTFVRAAVSGSALYTVQVSMEEGRRGYSCTCPYTEAHGDPCKHVWATILEAEKAGALGRLEGVVKGAEVAIDEAGEDEEEWEDEPDVSALMPKVFGVPLGYRAAPTTWKGHLEDLRATMKRAESVAPPPWPEDRQLAYVVDASASLTEGLSLTVELESQRRKPSGGWDRPKRLRTTMGQLLRLPDAGDRQIVQMLLGADQDGYYGGGDYQREFRFVVPEVIDASVLRQMCQTGRCRLRIAEDDEPGEPLVWDEGDVWDMFLEVRPSPGGRKYELAGSLRRGEERIDITQPAMLLRSGIFFMGDRVARFNAFGAFELVIALRLEQKIGVRIEQREELVAELFKLPRLPRLDLPEELRVEEIRPAPRPRLKVRSAPSSDRGYDDRLVAEVTFDYDGHAIRQDEEEGSVFLKAERKVIFRDGGFERAATDRLKELGFRQSYSYGVKGKPFRLAAGKLGRAVRALIGEGWQVEADGKLYRQPGLFKMEVKSGIDWFELKGDVQFGDQHLALPRLLEAIRRGEGTVVLDDGTLGMIPEEWLTKYGLLAGMSEQTNGEVRFKKMQVGFLDALLASMPETRVDEQFDRTRQMLRSFEGISPCDPPAGFVGTLREYQREGLGWIGFLREFGFGGCLADDMGLGKTVQVLALLEARRMERAGENGNRVGPSLVVAPRSLVFNWQAEAKRFSPGLRVLDHSTPDRTRSADHFENYDLVLTTYGLLRRDAEYFKDVQFDYAILDEAQAIKNPASESAKAARLLRANHRLALSGTPVQNHLGDLWSLFDYLNPGMLGGSSMLKTMAGGSGKVDVDTRKLLAKALRPFILRRTKEQVAKDLPEKTEQTIFCPMEEAQRKLYDELRDYYRQRLLNRVMTEGINKAKIEILEALLRLRQAACHPGLIDEKRKGDASAKLDLLLPQIAEVIDEGHKVLVFSQFTSFLSIVRQRLDEQKVVYEYLDGKTRDRQARVDRFQTDPKCKLFLISLKAGGLGLNLTAAEYVYLLDPWWNPAVEAQAIDRAHRIGQTQKVFAYRLIAQDTVEQKVLQLQESKRELADAIINADNSVIGRMDVKDLQLLLS